MKSEVKEHLHTCLGDLFIEKKHERKNCEKYPRCYNSQVYDDCLSLREDKCCKCLTDTEFKRGFCPFYKSNKIYKEGGEPIEESNKVL